MKIIQRKSLFHSIRFSALVFLLLGTLSSALLLNFHPVVSESTFSLNLLLSSLFTLFIGSGLAFLVFSPETWEDYFNSRALLLITMGIGFLFIYSTASISEYFLATPSIMTGLLGDTAKLISLLLLTWAFIQWISEQHEREKLLNRWGQKLRHQLDLSKRVADISSRFVKSGVANYDDNILYTLRTLGEFLHVDRSYLLIFSGDGMEIENSYEWCATGVKSTKSSLPDMSPKTLTWWTKQLANGQEIDVPDTQDMPTEASKEQDFFTELSIKSFFHLPIITQNGTIGALGFDRGVNTKHWCDEDIGYLHVVANVLADVHYKLYTERQSQQLRKEIEGKDVFENIVSRNNRMQDIFALLPDIAYDDISVIVEGETGTGKELIARAIHNLSPRKGKPFVCVNCGALPENLLESELFGYKAGAFTDAKRDKPGRFALAHGGTIFLDEIGEMPPTVQVKLLRVLQDGSYEPVGGTTTEEADVRVVAATNKNLPELVSNNMFREDLFYRLNVMRIELPPLRKRKEDIPLLVKHFIERFNALHERNVSGLSGEAMAALLSYDFPGNVRELENVLRLGFALCDGNKIHVKHLPAELKHVTSENNEPDVIRNEKAQGGLLQIEQYMIDETLKRNDGNKSAAAKELGISRKTLYRKLEKYGIYPTPRN